ncbi:MAG: methionyl-tRNA formyltransferase [Balneolaceae bacterium]|nr:methionyl-tRNA formyltransferase [Balneolaceae bacterium]
MKIVFMGSPEFAIPSLEKLHSSSHTISAVVSNVDKRRGRGKSLSPTPVKARAIELGLPVIEVEDLKSEEFANQLKALEPDLLVVVAFRVLPKSVLEIPKIGSVNLHASLLPKYRGAAPIHWAIMNGEEKTGCTIFFLDELVDTGNIILQKETDIGWEETTGDLYERLRMMGSDALLDAVNLIETGDYTLLSQNDAEASPAPKLFKEHCHTNFARSVDEVHNHIRGLCPFPTAFGMLEGERVNFYQAKPGPDANIDAGEILIKDDKMLVGCSNGTIEILELQFPGKRRMNTAQFLAGNYPTGRFN